MATKRYVFSRSANNYFNGHDLHVSDPETGAVISVNRKDDMLAVEVKDEGTIHTEPTNVQEAALRLGDAEADRIYSAAVANFWAWATMSLAENHGFDDVLSVGHSGGWLAVEGTELIEDGEISERPEQGSPWGRFLALAFEAVAEIETYRKQFRADLVQASVASAVEARSRVASEPIKVFILMWASEDGPNCDLYRNVPALVQAQGEESRAAAAEAMQRPGEAVVFDGDEGSVLRYCRVSEAV